MPLPFADSVVHPDSISIMHEQNTYGGMPKSCRLFTQSHLFLPQRPPAQQSSVFARAMQRIGHRVLLGNFDVLGGLVTYPGFCEADAEPEKLAAVMPKSEIDLSMISNFDKLALDNSAVVYTEYGTALDDPLPRQAKPELVRITLADYIAKLRDEFESAKKIREGNKKNEILKTVTRMLDVAESYVTANKKPPATTNVLTTPTVDPTKLILEMYAYRGISNDKLVATNLFDNVLRDGASKSQDPNRVKKLVTMLATKRNETTMNFRLAMMTGPSDEPKLSRIKIKVRVPLIPQSRWYAETEKGPYAALIAEIEAKRRAEANGGTPAAPPVKKEPAAAAKPAAAKTTDDDDNEEQPAEKPAGKAAAAVAALATKKASIKKTPAKAEPAADEEEEEPTATTPPPAKKATPAKKAAAPTKAVETPANKKRTHDALEAQLSWQVPERTDAQGAILNIVSTNAVKFAGMPEDKRFGPFANYKPGDEKADQDIKNAILNSVCFLNFVQHQQLLANAKEAEETAIKKHEEEQARIAAAEAAAAAAEEQKKKKAKVVVKAPPKKSATDDLDL